jgi:hypothetical protein
MAQFDLVGATRTMPRRSSVSWKAEHVLGHQDDDVHATLDRKAMMNVIMDGEAKFHWISAISQAQQKAPLDSSTLMENPGPCGLVMSKSVPKCMILWLVMLSLAK